MRSWQTYLRDGRDVFRRHWKLLVLPIPLALLITIWVVASTPTMYQSQAAIWSNSTAAQAAAINATEPTPLTPAAVQQSLLNELLSTNVFRASVATTSPLGAWLAAHPQSTLTPSGLAGLLHGSPPMSERIKTALLSGTSTAVQGPQVLSVSFQAQSPTLARETLNALLTNFATQRSALLPAATFQVLDAPSTPAGPTSGASKSLTTILVGLLVGIAVTLGAVAILVLLKSRKRRATAPDTPGPDRTGNDADGVVIPVTAATALMTTASPDPGARTNGARGAASEHPAAAEGPYATPPGDPTSDADGNGGRAAEVAPRRTTPREPVDVASAPTAGEETTIAGIVRDVRVVRNSGARRVVWVVSTSPSTPEIARRTRVTLGNAPRDAGTVRRVETTPEGVDVYVELAGVATDDARDGAPAASDRSWVGEGVTLTTDPAAPGAGVARNSRA